jgi:hypothetical protein
MMIPAFATTPATATRRIDAGVGKRKGAAQARARLLVAGPVVAGPVVAGPVAAGRVAGSVASGLRSAGTDPS